MTKKSFLSVTELAGDEVSREQVQRIKHRYAWVAAQCRNKRVLELACGTGQGLGLLASVASQLLGGDYSLPMLRMAAAHYGDRVQLLQLDAQQIPVRDSSIDVIALLEAIYYLHSAEQLVNDCRRVLKVGGKLLIVSANKDLYDFQPSPFSHRYYGVVELSRLLAKNGFTVECFGAWPFKRSSLWQRFLRPVKRAAVALDLIPKTMSGKKLLKRFIFGSLVSMPAEINSDLASEMQLQRLSAEQPDLAHKAIYCTATLDQDSA
jgi:SAM-dependent methyltransferase